MLELSKEKIYFINTRKITKFMNRIAYTKLHEVREWGEFFVLDEFPTAKVKRLIVKEGKNISYQYHNNRSEFWTIVQGNGYLILDGVLTEVCTGDTITIEKNVKHTIKAINNDLIIIEVQYGTECNEDDIVRITRNFNSIKTI